MLHISFAEIYYLCRPLLTDVIHTVGPVAKGHVSPTETNDLTSCYQNSLRLMKEHELSTVVSTVRQHAYTHLRRNVSLYYAA